MRSVLREVLVWLLLSMMACVRGPVDGFTAGSVVPTAMRIGDVDRVCRTGGALGHPLAALPKRDPHRALVIADTTAALCDDAAAREVAIQELVMPAGVQGPAKIAWTRDHRERVRRLKRRAASRHLSAFQHAESHWGELGGACPSIRSRDEIVYLVGLMAGTLAMLDDKSSGSTVGVPLDTLAKVGRAGACVDNTTWWSVPASLAAASWTLVPGDAPEGVDPWDALEASAREGATSGMRLGWALTAVIASNAGRDDRVRTAIAEASSSFESVPAPEDFRLLDAFARELIQHEADRIHSKELGYRAAGLVLPEPPSSPDVTAGPEDPFASKEDPFGSSDDPFSESEEP